MFKKFAASILVLSSLSALPVAAETCLARDEASSVARRMLQTELMVAALTCGLTEGYNQFVRRHTDDLVEDGQNLRAVFVRLEGRRGGERALNDFVTALANEASERNVAAGEPYCESVPALFEAVAALADNDALTAFAVDRFPSGHTALPSCDAPVVAEAAPPSATQEAPVWQGEAARVRPVSNVVLDLPATGAAETQPRTR